MQPSQQMEKFFLLFRTHNVAYFQSIRRLSKKDNIKYQPILPAIDQGNSREQQSQQVLQNYKTKQNIRNQHHIKMIRPYNCWN